MNKKNVNTQDQLNIKNNCKTLKFLIYIQNLLFTKPFFFFIPIKFNMNCYHLKQLF